MSFYQDDNIFAKIIAKKIPAICVYEDDDAIAFMDIMPQAKGHTLVVPRQGSRNLLDADPEVLKKTISVVQKVAQAIKKALGAEGIIITQYNEPQAGQTVFHLHFHIIPCFKESKVLSHKEGQAQVQPSQEDLEAVAAKIRTAL